MSTIVSDAAARDYVAVVVNGIAPADHARAIGTNPSSVSANVARAKRAMADGATLPDGTTGSPVARPDTIDAWMRANGHDDDNHVVMVSTFIDGTSDNRDAMRRVDARIAALMAERDGYADTITTRADMFTNAVGFDVSAIVDAYGDYVSTFAPSDDTPSDDTPSDDTPSDDTPSDDTPSDDDGS